MTDEHDRLPVIESLAEKQACGAKITALPLELPILVKECGKAIEIRHDGLTNGEFTHVAKCEALPVVS